ncbi:MAG: hypothetical protein Fur005_44980 [Roseiflexaceae bacterium]
MVIDGMGGMGKTSLALEVARRARQAAMFDAYLFASAKTTWLTSEGIKQQSLTLPSLDAFIREFAILLGQPQITALPDAAERRKQLLALLRERRVLLIFDNLETLIEEERSQIAEFLRRLPGENKAIITSRRRVGESADTIRLDRLDQVAALQLMAELGRRSTRLQGELNRSSSATKQALYQAAGGNPLALEYTLGMVAQRGWIAAAGAHPPQRSSRQHRSARLPVQRLDPRSEPYRTGHPGRTGDLPTPRRG